MADFNSDGFSGFEHNKYQAGMHVLSYVSLWLIVGIGVAFGIFGIFWGLR